LETEPLQKKYQEPEPLEKKSGAEAGAGAKSAKIKQHVGFVK